VGMSRTYQQMIADFPEEYGGGSDDVETGMRDDHLGFLQRKLQLQRKHLHSVLVFPRRPPFRLAPVTSRSFLPQTLPSASPNA
jgi:hypothetical protein